MTKKLCAISSIIISLSVLACTSEPGGSQSEQSSSALVSPSKKTAATTESAPLLWTSDHRELVLLVSELLREPGVQEARQQVVDAYQNSPSGKIRDGENTLESAVDSMVFGALLAITTENLAEAKIAWSETLAYTHAGVDVPDNRYAGETPDRMYRNVALSADYRYELHGRYDADASLDFSIEVIPGPANWGLPPLAVLQAKNIVLDSDGAFKITLDAQPAGDRVNHLQLSSKAKGLLIRDTVGDWSFDKPVQIAIKNLDAGKAEDLTREQMVERAVTTLLDIVKVSMRFYGGIWARELNQLTTYVRDLGWGIVGLNRFSIQDDEALVVTVDTLGAKYFGIQIDDLWLRSVDYLKHSSTMNLNQSTPNSDGSYTYVIAAQDPGYVNWVDTGGLNDGYLVARWELFPSETSGEGAVKSVKKIKLSELKTNLPEDSVMLSSDARASLLSDRRASYGVRMGR